MICLNVSQFSVFLGNPSIKYLLFPFKAMDFLISLTASWEGTNFPSFIIDSIYWEVGPPFAFYYLNRSPTDKCLNL